MFLVDKADLELTPIVPIVKYLEPPASAQPEEEEEDPALIFKERTGTDCETQTEIPYPVFPSVEVTEEELMKPTFWPKTSNQETRDRLLLQMEYLRRGFRKAKENGAKKYTFLVSVKKIIYILLEAQYFLSISKYFVIFYRWRSNLLI